VIPYSELADNGGRRSGIDRRYFSYSGYIPERRLDNERRNVLDRRNIYLRTNIERRAAFT